MRGNRQVGQALYCGVGTIPACAGEPPEHRPDGRPRRDYPRVCGGTRTGRRRPVSPSGLSPRVRGNHSSGCRPASDLGTIPACAGEPAGGRGGGAGTADYPRVCGGTDVTDWFFTASTGLSPRVRGNPGHPPGATVGSGTIPACAGEPGCHHRLSGRAADYPRVCGGTALRRTNSRCITGLSPRVRGNPIQVDRNTDLVWTIPACAGEPPPHRRPADSLPDYPRVCGGTPQSRKRELIGDGLSPRVRGNPFWPVRRR